MHNTPEHSKACTASASASAFAPASAFAYFIMSVVPDTVLASHSDLDSDDEEERCMRTLTPQPARSAPAAQSRRDSGNSLLPLEGGSDEGEEQQAVGKEEERDDNGAWRGFWVDGGCTDPDAVVESDTAEPYWELPLTRDISLITMGPVVSEPVALRELRQALRDYHVPFEKLWNALANRTTETICELEHVMCDYRAFAQSAVLKHPMLRTRSAKCTLRTLKAQLKMRWQELVQQLRPGDACVVNLRDVLRELANDIINDRVPRNKQFIDVVETRLRDLVQRYKTVLSESRRLLTVLPSTSLLCVTPHALLATPSV